MSQVIAAPGSSAGTPTDWVPTITGFSANPIGGIYRYQRNGNIVTLFFRQPNVGTSNATTFTLSLPFTAVTIANMSWFGYGSGVDNGATLGTAMLIRINSAGTTMALFTTPASGAWTAGGTNKAATGTIIYEATP